MNASPSKSSVRGARIAAVVVLFLFGILILAQGSSGPTPTNEAANPAGSASVEDPDTMPHSGPPPSADIVALLDGLSVGNEFNGWKVFDFNPTKDKVLWIEFGKDQAYFSVGIGSKGTGKPPPPIQTDQYEVGFGMVRPKGAAIPPDVMTQLAEQIASRIRKQEKLVPKPSAL